MPKKHRFLWLSSNLAILVAFMCSTYFMTGFATSKIELIIAVGIACFITAWATDMLNVVESLFKSGDVILAGLVAIILVPSTFIYETHGVLGTTTSFNQNFEKNTDFARKEKIAFDLAVNAAKNNNTIDVNKINSEIDNLIALNNLLINKNCKKGDWSCRAKANSEIENNNGLIEIKKQSLLRADSESKKNNSALKFIKKSLGNDSDWQSAHEVFKAGAIAILHDVTKAKDFQGNLLTYFAALISVLAIVLPHLSKRLCYEKGELENIPTLSRLGNPVIEKIKKSARKSPLRTQAHKTIFGFDLVDTDSFATDQSVSNNHSESVSTNEIDTPTDTLKSVLNTEINTPVRINSVSNGGFQGVSKRKNNTPKGVSKLGKSNSLMFIETDDAVKLMREKYPKDRVLSYRKINDFFKLNGFKMSQSKIASMLKKLEKGEV